MNLVRDVAPLLWLHAGLLLLTMTFGGGNVADAKVQCIWLLFLLPGWLIAPVWFPTRRALGRYLTGMITSVACHGLLAALGGWINFGMDVYLTVWCVLVGLALWHRSRTVNASFLPRAVPRRDVLVIATLMLFVVAVYRTPISNDIGQFVLQQQDMSAAGSLRASSIGMEAFGVDHPMPRWRAQLWHLLPCLVGRASGVAVDQVLFRYAAIPCAFSVLLSLMEIVGRFTRRRVPPALVLLAMLGPVVLYYRNFCVFNYSFRVTNNLLLDKDFALFFLIPAIGFLGTEWVRGSQRCLWLIIALIPAILRFHPLTPVYLILVLAPLLAMRMPLNVGGVLRAAALYGFVMFSFVAVVLIGDAQGNHEQIQEIIRLDHDGYENQGRPLHYWIGFYNTIPGNDFPIDTTAWTDGRFHLQSRLLIRCGMLAVMQLCLPLLLIRGWSWDSLAIRVAAAGVVAVSMLWGMWLVSGPFLTPNPHYAAGFERLHWFVYSIAIVVVAMTIAVCLPYRRVQKALGAVGLIWIATSAALYRAEVHSPLMSVRGFNSMLDQELEHASSRRIKWDQVSPGRTLTDMRPDYLRDDDRVLFVSRYATSHYWFTKQGVYWCDPYVEAFALYHGGESFLRDRRMFFDLLDRQTPQGVAEWLSDKGITVVADLNPDSDEYWPALMEREGMANESLEPGVWRLIPRD